MSAAAARRRKQLLAKKSASDNEDPITTQLHALLLTSTPTVVVEEATAYEALQLAQSQLRKSVNRGDASDISKATVVYGYDICMTLLSQHGKASVASQLLALLVQTLLETHTICDEAWIGRIQKLHEAYVKAVKEHVSAASEKRRLMRLQSKFLKKALGWSDSLGEMRYGALEIHELLGNHSWALSEEEATAATEDAAASADDDDDDEDGDWSTIGLKCEAVQHLALAEQPTQIGTYLQSLPAPTPAQIKAHHDCPPSTRDTLLTRAILAFCALENLRDAKALLDIYMDKCETRDIETLKTSYLDKKDSVAPSHVIFHCMLLSILTKGNAKTGPLFNWLLKSFQTQELAKMYKPEVLKAYTTKIGRVYFDIQPPPSMMSTLENMMSMMGGAGGPGGMGGMNPAMMQAMMQGGGGF